VRNWLHAEDHASGIVTAFEKGKKGEIYNIASDEYVKNIDLTRRVLKILGKPESLIQKVKDRPGHDRRYAMDASKIKKLGWKPRRRFDEALRETVLWYRENRPWWERIKNKNEDFKKYYAKQYSRA
jgi:dTDP-glucose 4,6-dehydratase